MSKEQISKILFEDNIINDNQVFHMHNNLDYPIKKKKNAILAHNLSNINEDDIILIVDDTLFKTAKCGIIITDKLISFKQSSQTAISYDLKSITDIYSTKRDIFVNGNKVISLDFPDSSTINNICIALKNIIKLEYLNDKKSSYIEGTFLIPKNIECNKCGAINNTIYFNSRCEYCNSPINIEFNLDDISCIDFDKLKENTDLLIEFYKKEYEYPDLNGNIVNGTIFDIYKLIINSFINFTEQYKQWNFEYPSKEETYKYHKKIYDIFIKNGLNLYKIFSIFPVKDKLNK